MPSQIGADKRRSATDVDPPEIPTAEEATIAALKSGPDLDNVGAEGLLPEFSFELDYTDTRGRHWGGQFKAHVLTIQEKVQVGVIRARMAGGVSVDMLDVQTVNLLEMQAHLAVALDDAPTWAKKLSKLRDPNVLYAVYEEVAKHEARFHGAGPGEGGEGTGS